MCAWVSRDIGCICLSRDIGYIFQPWMFLFGEEQVGLWEKVLMRMLMGTNIISVMGICVCEKFIGIWVISIFKSSNLCCKFFKKKTKVNINKL